MNREQNTVHAILDSRPMARDGILLIHSAFRQLSRAGFRAERVCEALIDYMKDGTVLMPAMSPKAVTPENPVFDELRTPSYTGALTEVFRTGYATNRSLHPTHSVAGCGLLAEFLLSMHHLGTTPCPGGSPYGLMRDFDAYILLLGVGMECCTAFHHAEEMIAPDLYVRPMADAEEYDLIDRHGTIHRVKTRRHPRLPRNFPKFAPVLKARGELAQGEVFATSWLLFSARDLYRTLFRALARRQDATLN